MTQTTQIPLRRQPLENHISYIKELSAKDSDQRIDEALDKFINNGQSVSGIVLFGALGVIGLFALWNLKNMLKINIFPGGHHGIIDDINKSLGL